MTQDFPKFRSSIKPELLRQTLLRGTFLAATGASLLLFSGVFLPEPILKSWGISVFFLSIALIALGLIPYRRLKQLETAPHEIIIPDDVHFLFCWKRKPVLAVPFSSIVKASFISSEDVYGIGIWILDSSSLGVYNNFDLPKFQQKSRKNYGCDLFLPYFSERTFRNMNLS